MKKIIFSLCILSTLSAFAWVNSTVNYRGEQNSWGETAMAQDNIPGGEYWKLTLQITSSGNDEFKFANLNWTNSWSYDSVSIKNKVYPANWNSGGNTIINNVQANYYYTFRMKDNGYASTFATVMETSELPETITSVALADALGRCSLTNSPVTVKVTLSGNKCNEEKVIIRYTTNDWTDSYLIEAASGSGAIWSGEIPGMGTNMTVEFYVFTTTFAHDSSDLNTHTDLCTINYNNNGGENYYCYFMSKLTAYLVGSHSSWNLNNTNEMTPKLVGGGNSNYWGITITNCLFDGEFKLAFGQDWIMQWGNNGPADSDYWITKQDTQLDPLVPMVENDNNLIWKLNPSNYVHITCYEPYQGSNALDVGIMMLSENPAEITNTTDNTSDHKIINNSQVNLDILLNKPLCPQENLFVRYTSNNWVNSFFSEATGSFSSYSAIIPGMASLTCQYYIFTTTLTNNQPLLINQTDLMTINCDVNGTANYSIYFVPEPGFISLIIICSSGFILKRRLGIKK